VLRRGSPPLQAQAIAQLAELLRAAGKTIEAARFYTHLDGPLADTPCREGQTGRAVVAALPAGDPVRAWFRDAEPWPRSDPEKAVTKVSPDQATQNWNSAAVWLSGDGTRWSPQVIADLDLQTRKLIGRDAQGVRQWEVEVGTQDGVNRISFFNTAYVEAQVAGHLLVTSVGGRMVAVDQLGQSGKPLWTVDSVQADNSRSWLIAQLRLRMQLQGQLRQGPALRPRVPQTTVVTTDYVAYQEGRLLKAVEPVTGQLLWLRDDLVGSSELFGDDELLFVVPPDSDTMLVLSALDGHELGRRPTVARDQRFLTRGRCLLTLQTGAERAELKLLDPWPQQTVWSRTFSAQARMWPLDNLELGVLEPDGSFVVLDLADGRPILQAKVDAINDLDSMLVLRSDRRYVLVANHPEPKKAGPISFQTVPGQMRADGKAYAFDARTGARLWATDVTQQGLRVNHPSLSPVLTFFRRHQKQVQIDANSWRSEPPTVQVRCLDSRTGKTLHESKIENTHEQSYGLEVDPQAGSIQIQTRLEQVTFRYRKPG
jgi:hypothetical protein